MTSPGSSSSLVTRLASVTSMYNGWKKGDACIAHATNDQVGGGVPGDGPSPNDSWGYQSCTETLHTFSTPSGSWRSFTFDKASLDAQCQRYYNVTPDTHHLEKWGGGYAIADKNLTTNLIWSNGELVSSVFRSVLRSGEGDGGGGRCGF